MYTVLYFGKVYITTLKGEVWMDIMGKNSDKDSKMLASIRCHCVRIELNVAWACLSKGIKCTHQGYGNYFFSDSLIQQKAGMRG